MNLCAYVYYTGCARLVYTMSSVHRYMYILVVCLVHTVSLIHKTCYITYERAGWSSNLKRNNSTQILRMCRVTLLESGEESTWQSLNICESVRTVPLENSDFYT